MAKLLQDFKGVQVATSSTVGQPMLTHIDRTCVRAFRTLLGEVLYIVEGTMGVSTRWVTVSEQYKGFSDAWAFKKSLDAEIEREKSLHLWGTTKWTQAGAK